MKLYEAMNRAVKMGSDCYGFRPKSWQGSGVYFTCQQDEDIVEKFLAGFGPIGIGMSAELIEKTNGWEAVSIQHIARNELVVTEHLLDDAETPRALIERAAEFSSPDSGARQSLLFADRLKAQGWQPAFYIKDGTITVGPRIFNELMNDPVNEPMNDQ